MIDDRTKLGSFLIDQQRIDVVRSWTGPYGVVYKFLHAGDEVARYTDEGLKVKAEGFDRDALARGLVSIRNLPQW